MRFFRASFVPGMLVCAVAALTLTACATNEDPSKGGFFSGVKNLTDGTYQQRVDDRKKTLEDEQDKNTQQQRALQRTNEERDAVAAQRTAAEAKAAAMDADLAAMKKRLAAAELTNARAKQQAADLKDQISDLEARINLVKQDSFTSDADKQARLKELQKEKEDLENQVDMALHR